MTRRGRAVMRDVDGSLNLSMGRMLGNHGLRDCAHAQRAGVFVCLLLLSSLSSTGPTRARAHREGALAARERWQHTRMGVGLGGAKSQCHRHPVGSARREAWGYRASDNPGDSSGAVIGITVIGPNLAKSHWRTGHGQSAQHRDSMGEREGARRGLRRNHDGDAFV